MWGMMSDPFEDEGQVVLSDPSCNHERGVMPSGPLWILEATCSSFECVTPAFLLSDPKRC